MCNLINTYSPRKISDTVDVVFIIYYAVQSLVQVVVL